jgi:protein-tyrosine phosphatase
MAAAVLASKARSITEIEIFVSSSGTSGWHIGQGPHPTSKKVWEKAGYVHDHEASQFKVNDFFINDYILVMDSSNFENVISLAPSQDEAKKVFYLRSFDPELHQIDPLSSQYHQLEVPDPYNQPEDAYEKVLKMIESAIDGFIKTVIPTHDA